MKQGKKWKRIGWLMLAGELMLLLFLLQWLYAQHKLQEQRLHQDIQVLFARTESELTDSLLNQTIAVILKAPKKGIGKVRFQIATTIDTGNHDVNKDSLLRSLDLPDQGKIIRESLPGNKHKVTFKRSRTDSPPGQEPFPEELKKVFRIALLQTANDQKLYQHGFSAAIDSNVLLREFRKELREKQPGFIAAWTKAGSDTAKLFIYRQDNDPSRTIAVTGYRYYLLRNLYPQISFSLILLLLIGLAFGLSYRMMRQQALFNRQKDNFISNISHELKTPVATTKVAIEALTTYNGLENPERTRKYLNVAAWEMDRLSTMIDRIMNMIQTEHGSAVLEKEPLRLAALLEEITNTLQPIFKEKSIRIHWLQLEQQVAVLADKMHLQGVLYNLLDNAVKYGGDLISISLAISGNNALLKITDNGPGIKPEYHQRVFDNFFRIPSGNRHDVKGHGLGLSYARDIVLAHEGSIGLESIPGSETTFILTLPLINRYVL